MFSDIQPNGSIPIDCIKPYDADNAPINTITKSKDLINLRLLTNIVAAIKAINIRQVKRALFLPNTPKKASIKPRLEKTDEIKLQSIKDNKTNSIFLCSLLIKSLLGNN